MLGSGGSGCWRPPDEPTIYVAGIGSLGEVDPTEGLDPDGIVFIISEGPMMEERALALAAYLRFGPLPVPLEVTSDPDK